MLIVLWMLVAQVLIKTAASYLFVLFLLSSTALASNICLLVFHKGKGYQRVKSLFTFKVFLEKKQNS